MASAITSLPGQQPPAAGEINEQPNYSIPQAVSSTATATNWHSTSGSIGPFFGVISVLTVLAILSCVLGRVCSRRAEAEAAGTPFKPIIKDRGRFFGWLKWRSRCYRSGDVEIGAKVTAVDHVKAKDSDVDGQAPQS